MREKLIAHLKTTLPSTFKVTDELPWTVDDEPLFQKNLKVVYVDKEDVKQEVILSVLNDTDVIEIVTSIDAFVVTDAKTLPKNYETALQTLGDAKNTTLIDSNKREADIETSYVDGDNLLTKMTYRFTTYQ